MASILKFLEKVVYPLNFVEMDTDPDGHTFDADTNPAN
jgi:hypothetical protein